jgi:AraC-like DNA-binding protein
VAPYVVDDIDHHGAPGSVICVPPGHVYLTGKTAQPRGEFAWAIMQTNHPSLGEADPIQRAIDALCDIGAATWPMVAGITDEVRHIFDLASSDSSWAVDAEVRHRLCAILFRLVSATTAKEPDSSDLVHRGVQQALSWIDGHLGEVATVADMVAISGLSNTRFFDAFKAATGTSPKDYLMRRKTDLAREWLGRDEEVTVTEVAHALGFSSSQQFATVFRRYQGTTPRAVRESSSQP